MGLVILLLDDVVVVLLLLPFESSIVIVGVLLLMEGDEGVLVLVVLVVGVVVVDIVTETLPFNTTYQWNPLSPCLKTITEEREKRYNSHKNTDENILFAFCLYNLDYLCILEGTFQMSLPCNMGGDNIEEKER